MGNVIATVLRFMTQNPFRYSTLSSLLRVTIMLPEYQKYQASQSGNHAGRTGYNTLRAIDIQGHLRGR